MKVTVFKATADGEQIQVEIPLTREHFDKLKNGGRLRDILAPAFDLADDRLLEFNLRIMKMNRLVSKLPPEAAMAVKNVLEIHAGQVQGPPPASVHDQAMRDYEDLVKEKQAERDAAEKRSAKAEEEAPQ